MLVNGHQLHVESYGPASGPAVILLHHGLGSVYAWEEQVPALISAGYYVVAYERWGYGRSDARPALSMPYFEEDLDDLRAILDQCAIQDAALVGHSDGGTIALYFAARHPERLNSLVSIAAHVYIEAKMYTDIESIRQAYCENIRFRRGLERVHAERTDGLFYGWYNGWNRQENKTWDMRSELKHITCRSLVVQGLDDEHASPQHARDIAAGIPGAELWLVPGAAHVLPQDKPELFNERLLEFLQRAGKSKSSSNAVY